MVNHQYNNNFRHRVVAKALSQGIKPTIREFRVARNTLRKWLRLHQKSKLENLGQYQRHPLRTSLKFETLVVSFKERNPAWTIKDIHKLFIRKTGKVLSNNGIYKVLERYAMTGRSYLPLRRQTTAEVEQGMKLARLYIINENMLKAASVLNKMPALADFSILEGIPPNFLSLRRKTEQLESLLDKQSPIEIYKKANRIRKLCERKKLIFTAIFTATIEMNCLNRLGHLTKIFLLYKKYAQYLTGLTPSLKYTFLMECFMSYTNTPEKFPNTVFRRLPTALERFCLRLPKVFRPQWYDAISACFQIVGELNEAVVWMRKLIEEVPGSKREYLPDYNSLLATKGSYGEILEVDISNISAFSVRQFLTFTLARGNALLSSGQPEQALDITLNAFSKAEKEDLYPAMAGFAFFVAGCYAAMKEKEKSRRYLKMSAYFSRNVKKTAELYSLLLKFVPRTGIHTSDQRIRLIYYYLRACTSLRNREYLRTYKFAEKKGLLGFFHRIVLLHPEAVINRLHKGKDTFLPQEFLKLPVFREEIPAFILSLLKEKESIFYGARKIEFSVRSRDFHLLVYLFLNRKKNLDREDLLNIFYRNIRNPIKALTKALSRIRKALNLAKGILHSRREGVFFNVEAKIDLEEFEERFKTGKILEKIGEGERALQEYRQCFALYKYSPFEQMGYYYNFAEERRTVVRNMFKDICDVLMRQTKEKRN